MKENFDVRILGVFDPFARGNEQADSDIDILVEFMECQKTFDNYMDLKFYLEEVSGRKVDLIIETDLKPRLREQVLEEVVYV